MKLVKWAWGIGGAVALLLVVVTLIWIGQPTVPAQRRAPPARLELNDPRVLGLSQAVEDQPIPLAAQQTVRARVGTSLDSVCRFQIEVPEDAILVELRLTEAPINLDLYCMHVFTWQSQGEAEFASATEAYNETLRITPWDALPLEPGNFVVEVRPGPGAPPRVGYLPVHDEVPFALHYRLVQVGQPAKWSINGVYSLELSEARGHAAVGTIECPAGLHTMRIDLFDATTSMHLYLGRVGPVVHSDNALWVHDGAECRKWVVLTPNSQPPLEAGKYVLAVVDPYQAPAPVKATLAVRDSAEVPEQLLAIPELPVSEDPWSRAVAATVELIVEGNTGGGSGVIVSPDGLVLTNFHVVIDQQDRPAPEHGVLVALTLDPELPPVDLFRASPVYLDEANDLALLRITRGFYHQPLGPDFKFPWIAARWDSALPLGTQLTVIGYPWIGGVSGRVTVTLTSGVLSGRERRGKIVLWKTDADFHPGSSGGPVLDEEGRLVGLASETVEQEAAAGKIGWVRPLATVPETWKTLIRQSTP